MIIQKDIPKTPETNIEYLSCLLASFLYHKIRRPDGTKYGIGFYNKELKRIQSWIKDNEPSSSIARLRNKNQCSYCNSKLSVKFGVGDHIVGRKLDSALWIVPCCTQCNSSKGNRDLIHWWCNMKKRNIVELHKDVIAIYVRAKYRLFDKEDKLYDKISDSKKQIFENIWRKN